MKGKLLACMALAAMTTAQAQLPTHDFGIQRGMWASINAKSDASLGDYTKHNNKILLNWRMLPTDTWETAFHIYSRTASSLDATLIRKATNIGKSTCYQTAPPSVNTVYYLIRGDYFTGTPPLTITDAGQKKEMRETALDSICVDERLWKERLPYVSIPLKSTEDVSGTELASTFKYQANDCTVADLDGDGEMEIVVKRLLTYYNSNGEVTGGSEGAGDSDARAKHIVIWDAYKLDGTFLWRIKSGPNIIAGNSSNFAVADLDGDGCAEFVTKTGEGTVFGDGTEIGDTDGDGRTDYRSIWPAGHYTGDGPKGYGGPEFFSVCDGKTGKELARANFIARGPEGQTPAQWAANWEANDWKWDPRSKKYAWKLANSLRLGVASFKGTGLQIFLGRGVYGRTVVEGWEYEPKASGEFAGTLTRLWKIDTDDAGGQDKNKDGKTYKAYAGQGNHAFNVADLDGDGKDEVMYGSCAWDDDGTGLWTTGLGHGDANHVGRFLQDREGMQVYHCLEGGKTMVALHDAKDGKLIWKKDASSDNDTGRCMVADIDPARKGYEFWFYKSSLYDQDGNDTGVSMDGSKLGCAAAIWFDGSLLRQGISEGGILHSHTAGRTFTMWRYDMSLNNGTKGNPGWYGDFLGDWREEIILPDQTKLVDLKVFSTWYPSDYKLPYLMSDHTYFMQTIHQQVGYNQPNNIGGYYLGYGMDMSKVPLSGEVTGIDTVTSHGQHATNDNRIYDLSGRVVAQPKAGIYVRNGKKFIVR